MHWFNNLKTRSKLTAGFGLVIALLIAIVITAWLFLRTLHDTEPGWWTLTVRATSTASARAPRRGAGPPGGGGKATAGSRRF
jgi:hypothetical protein